jgi:Tfp pilus assembly protein PilO
MPALPLDEAGQYVAAAYVVFVLLLVIYVGIMAAKLARISRDLEELAELAERREADSRRQTADRGEPVAAEEPAVR